MPRRIGRPQRLILHVAIPIQRLRVRRPLRNPSLPALLTAHLEPERLIALTSELSRKARLVEVDRQALECHAIHAARGAPRHHTIRAHEPRQRRIVVARMIIQQPRAVQSLAGVIEAGLRNRAGAARFAPRVEVLPTDDRAVAVGGEADAAEVIAVQRGHGIRARVAIATTWPLKE